MPSNSPIVSSPKKSDLSASTSLKKSTTDKAQRIYNQKTSYDYNGVSSEKSSAAAALFSSLSSQKKQHQQRGRQHQNRIGVQSKLQQNPPLGPMVMKRGRSHSAAIYAGPDFMNDAPSPSSLPLPSSVMSKTTKQQQQHPDESKPYVMDPISEIQEKLRMMLKVQ